MCATGCRCLDHGVCEDSSAKETAVMLKNRIFRDMVPHFGTCVVYRIFAFITTLVAKLLVWILGILKFGGDVLFVDCHCCVGCPAQQSALA